MKKLLSATLFVLFVHHCVCAQNFTGQWKGTFLDKSTSFVGWGGDKCDYVLELEVTGNNVSGYSYTYFTDNGKKYYTICSLKGTVNKVEKYVEVRETVRTKTNVPNNIRNCFQVHKLSYAKTDDAEVLKGEWLPAPGQEGDCGFGSTLLERRLLKRIPTYNPVPSNTSITKTPVAKRNTSEKSMAKIRGNNPSLKPTTDLASKTQPPIIVDKATIPALIDPYALPEKIVSLENFEKRNNNLLKTIEVENSTVKVDLYDNGAVDGDSVSLFYNGNLLFSHKRLSEKPISLTIDIASDNTMNELVMYADNLGTIPPNTALMIVTDGTKRYEIRITSDLQKSGTIRFKLKPTQTSN